MPKTKTEVRMSASLSRGDIAALTAAGRRLPVNSDMTKISRTGRGWQDRCWEFYDIIGEYRYGVDWVGNMLSKATLFLAKDGTRVADAGDGVDYVFSLFGGPEAQGQMLRECGIHMTVAGELYLVGTTENGVDHWLVVASTELTSRGGNHYASGKLIKSDTDVLIIRIWRPHPRRWRDANSPSRAVLSILAELDALTKRIFAEIDSRLAGAGIFFIPSEMTMPTTQDAADPDNPVPTQTLADRFQKDLTDAMMTAIGDREDASAMVPIVASAPGEHIGNLKHITFWSELDEQAPTLRNEAIRRLALGMDMPPDVLTGAADVNHWNMWAVDEAAIKAHAEPLLALICDSLTEGYLRPLLVDDGMDPVEAESYTVMADTSMLRLRPNRSKEAFELYDRMQIDGAALRRETGFDDDDAPGPVELRQVLLRKVASGSTTPELVATALQLLGVFGAGGIPLSPPRPAVQGRPAPSLVEHPTQEPPEQPGATDLAASSVPVLPPSGDGLLGACDVMVYRVLERAGNRIRATIKPRLQQHVPAVEMHQHVPVNAAMCDELLADAFTGLDRFVACRDIDADHLANRLEAYCRTLLVQGRAHDARTLQIYLTHSPSPSPTVRALAVVPS